MLKSTQSSIFASRWPFFFAALLISSTISMTLFSGITYAAEANNLEKNVWDR